MTSKTLACALMASLVFVSLGGCAGAQEELLTQFEAQQAELAARNTEIEALQERVNQLEGENQLYTQRLSDLDQRVRALTMENNRLRDEQRTARALSAAIRVSSDPETAIPLASGECHWTLIISEINGVGVSLQRLTKRYYASDGSLLGERIHDRDSSPTAWPLYVPPNGTISSGSGSHNIGPTVTVVHLFEGIDDNGNKITASLEVPIGHD